MNREAMTDAVLDIICPGPIVDNELAINVLTDALAVILAGGTQSKPETNIDHVTAVIGETIADGVRQLLSRGKHH
jgi:hypothetical protein